MKKTLEAAVKDYMRTLRGRAGGEDLSRIEGFFSNLLGQRAAVDDPRQRKGEASPLWVPGLPASPWHDPAKLSFLAELKAAKAGLLAEGRALLDAGALVRSSESREDLAYEGWIAFDLMILDAQLPPGRFRVETRTIPENLERAPTAARLLERLPLLGDCFYSALLPGGKVSPHYSHFNGKLICHLGLSVPPDCAIRAAGETRSWMDGEVLLFDDTYEHDTWNLSTQPRLLLHLSVWNPDLTPFEVAALQGWFDLSLNP